ncbi:RNase H-like domain-containing protein, partial [Rhizobium oryzihabitans]|uniref:RNase H-like domain-containing protein n=1 Tax=Rhizobium oryzihabitans TaxID=2267833 RepID=UPI004035E1D2
MRKFVHNFSAISAPLTDLTGKAGTEFDWHKWPDDKLQAFDALKHAISKVPLLKIPDITKPFQVYCDASLQGVG